MPSRISVQLAREIVDTLKTICSHDIYFIDTDGQISASTDPDRAGGYHSGGLEAVRRGEIVTIEQDMPEGEVRQGINMPIRFHNHIVAVIGITGEPGEVERYADLAQRITLMLLREHEMDARHYDTRTRTGYLVRALTDRENVDPGFVSEVLKMNGLSDRSEDWRTVVVEVSPAHEKPLSAIEAAVEDAVAQIRECLHTCRFPDEYILIIKERGREHISEHTGERGTDRWEQILRTMAAGFPQDVRIGIGSARRLSRQDLSYRAAKLAVQSLPADENIASFDDVRLEILLGSVSEDAGSAYMKKCLKGLDETDRQLLGTYFGLDMSLKETAKHYYLHVNTLQYRLKRIRERCGLDPRCFRDASMLYTALRLEAMRGSGTI